MILHVFNYELIRYLRSGQSLTFVLSVALMLCASLFLSLREHKLIESSYQENLLQSRLNWESQAEKDPHDAAHDGTYVIKPSHPLALIDRGVQKYAGQVIHLRAHERQQSSLSEIKDQTGIYRFGALTPSFVLLYIFPLLIVFLGYGAFAKEKEMQTLRLVKSQGVSIRQVAAGKWLAIMVQVILLFALFIGTVAITTNLMQNDVEVGLLEWLSIGALYMLFFIIFANVVVLVSILAKSSGVSLVLSLSVWILVVLIAPKLSTNIAGHVHPFPTYQTFRENIYLDQQNGLNGHNFWNEAAQDFQQKVLQEYGVDTIEELPVDYGGLLLAEGEKYESEIYTKHFDLLREQYEKQRSIYRLSSALSPFLSVRFVSMALARTDYGFQWHLEDQAEKYRVYFNTELNMNIAENAKGVEEYEAGKELWGAIDRFQYEWQSTSEILRDHRVEYAILLSWVVVSFLLMFSMSNRVEVV